MSQILVRRIKFFVYKMLDAGYSMLDSEKVKI
jgi:hypothetical protein